MRKLMVAVVLSLFAFSCGAGDDPTVEAPDQTAPATQAPEVDEVAVELGEWAVLPDPDAAVAGEITFNITNGGREQHEFVVVRTDLDAGDLPTTDDGSVDEDQVDVVGEVEDLEPGDEEELEIDLEEGSYVLMCNLVEEGEGGDEQVHFKLGMRTPFEVS